MMLDATGIPTNQISAERLDDGVHGPGVCPASLLASADGSVVSDNLDKMSPSRQARSDLLYLHAIRRGVRETIGMRWTCPIYSAHGAVGALLSDLP